MSIIKSNGAGETSGDFYNGVISQSLRLDVGSDYKLDREMVTPTSVTGTICTASWWMKKSNHDIVTSFINCRDNQASGNYAAYWSYDRDFGGNNHHTFYGESAGGAIRVGTNTTVTPFRDSSAWYHVVIRMDTSDSTAANRIRIYINGVDQVNTLTNVTYGDQNYVNPYWNNAGEHLILFGNGEDSGDAFDGYVAEFNWVDGQSLAPETFGELKKGVWIPKKITLTASDYGLNGSRYTFADSSDIGKDTSGVGNDLDRVSNLNAYDVVPDTPENNFCTLNYNRSGVPTTLTEGGLTYSDSNTSGPRSSTGTFGATSGKYYFEIRMLTDNYSTMAGFMDVSQYTGNHLATDTARGTGYLGWDDRGYLYPDQTDSVLTGHDFTSGDVLGFAIDIDAGKAFIRKNADAFLASANPSSGDNPNHTFTAGQPMTPFIGSYRSIEYTLNCGQDSSFGGRETATTNADSNGFGTFHTAPPSGYLALCTANLPEPTIGPSSTTQSTDHFESSIYEGNGGTQNIAVSFKPDWTWIKNRDANDAHQLFDSSRGVTNTLPSNTTTAEDANDDTLTAFISTGFSLGDDVTVNTNNESYVAWNWKANGGTKTTNDASATSVGTIDSAIQANTTSGFSIVTYTGTGSAGTIAHGLGVVPKWYFCRRLSNTGHWEVYHASNTAAPATEHLRLSTDDATGDDAQYFNDTDPTSTVFSVGDHVNVNASSNTYVAYVFAEIEGYSKFGVYTGNNTAANGPMVFTGFKPAYLMVKNTASGSWTIYDNKRKAYNPRSIRIAANVNNTETDTSTQAVDFYAGGFKILSNNSDQNASSATYIYMAFAKEPFKYSNGG